MYYWQMVIIDHLLFYGSIINVGVLKGDDFGAPTFFAKKRAWS